MAIAKKGDRVKINYVGTLEDGTIFDSTFEETESGLDACDTDECDSGDCGCGCAPGPMELTIDAGEFFPKIEEALVGMAPGEKKSVSIPSLDAFVAYDEEKVFTVPRSELPDDLKPEVGDELVLSDEDDESMGVTVVEVNDDGITFDANHPLAGADLNFEIELVEII